MWGGYLDKFECTALWWYSSSNTGKQNNVNQYNSFLQVGKTLNLSIMYVELYKSVDEWHGIIEIFWISHLFLISVPSKIIILNAKQLHSFSVIALKNVYNLTLLNSYRISVSE